MDTLEWLFSVRFYVLCIFFDLNPWPSLCARRLIILSCYIRKAHSCSLSLKFFFFYSLYSCTCSIWKFLGLHWSCSWDLHHRHCNTESEPHLRPILFFQEELLQPTIRIHLDSLVDFSPLQRSSQSLVFLERLAPWLGL